MEFRIVKKFYSDIQANIYYMRLKEAGIQCFLSHENISTILPLSDGGVSLNVSTDDIEEGLNLIALIDKEQFKNTENEDYSEATQEDIKYAKEVKDYENWLNGGWIDKEFISSFLFVAFVIILLVIIIKFFFPFSK